MTGRSALRGLATRQVAARSVAAVAAASAVLSIGIRSSGGIDAQSYAGHAAVAEVGLIAVLIVYAARTATDSAWWLAPLSGVAAIGLVVLRFDEGAGRAATAGMAVWSASGLLAATAGRRALRAAQRAERELADAQRRQRLLLAEDLHDFVAHDVSEMLALAQAGRVMAERDGSATTTFQMIEQAAERALRSMDQTVHMLHPTTAGRDTQTLPGLAGLGPLADRFAAAYAVPTVVRMDAEVSRSLDRVPPNAQFALFRVAVEALTNISRHARSSSAVVVSVERAPHPAGAALELVVANDATRDRPAPDAPTRAALADGQRQGGLGLEALARRIERLGGELRAGPSDQSGWRVIAVVPWETG